MTVASISISRFTTRKLSPGSGNCRMIVVARLASSSYSTRWCLAMKTHPCGLRNPGKSSPSASFKAMDRKSSWERKTTSVIRSVAVAYISLAVDCSCILLLTERATYLSTSTSCTSLAAAGTAVFIAAASTRLSHCADRQRGPTQRKARWSAPGRATMRAAAFTYIRQARARSLAGRTRSRYRAGCYLDLTFEVRISSIRHTAT